MISHNYGSSKAIKGRLGRAGTHSLIQRKNEAQKLCHFHNSPIFHLQGENQAVVQASPRIWAIASDANLCSSHHGGRTEIVSVVLKQTSLMNLSSYRVVMNYKD